FRYLDKGKPSVRMGRKAMDPSGIARLPKGVSPPEIPRYGSKPNRCRELTGSSAGYSTWASVYEWSGTRPVQLQTGEPDCTVWRLLLSGLCERTGLMFAQLRHQAVRFLRDEDGPT